MEEIKDLGAATSSSRLPAACIAAAVSSKVPDLVYPVLMFALAQEDDISFLITPPWNQSSEDCPPESFQWDAATRVFTSKCRNPPSPAVNHDGSQRRKSRDIIIEQFVRYSADKVSGLIPDVSESRAVVGKWENHENFIGATKHPVKPTTNQRVTDVHGFGKCFRPCFGGRCDDG